MSEGRKRTARTLATLSIAALGGSLLVAAPAQAMPASPDALPIAKPHTPQKHKHKHKAPAPTIHNLQARASELNRQAKLATSQFNAARRELADAQQRLQRLQHQQSDQQTQVSDLRGQIAADVSPQYHAQRTALLVQHARQADSLRQQLANAKQNLTLVAVTKRRLGVQKKAIDHKAAQVNDLLSQLKERAAQEQASRSQDRTSAPAPAPTPSSAPASGGAAAALAYAMSKVGDAYVYGAAGPSAFDCSGLTMAAWQQAGVSLPHSAAAQMSSGTPVSESQLQPGDLVFYYSPVSHVGMYIGHGQIVNAENPSVGVKITGVNTMPYAGAVRPG